MCWGLRADDDSEVPGKEEGGVWDDDGVEFEDVKATGAEDDDEGLDGVRKLDLVVTRWFNAEKGTNYCHIEGNVNFNY